MKNILLGILIAASLSSLAVVKKRDGSVILSREEAMTLHETVERMVAAGKSQAAQIKALQVKIDEFEKGKCI